MFYYIYLLFFVIIALFFLIWVITPFVIYRFLLASKDNPEDIDDFSKLKLDFKDGRITSKSSDSVAKALLDHVEKAGFLPTYLEFVPSGDKRYNIKGMLQDIKRDPDIRWAVILTSFLQIFLPKRKKHGESYTLNPKSYLCSRMYSTYFAALTAEELIKYLQNDKNKKSKYYSKIETLLHKIMDEIISDAHYDKDSGTYLYNFTERPKIRNKFMNKVMTEWMDNYDIDDTAIIFSVLKRYLDVLFESTDKDDIIRFYKIEGLLKNNNVLGLVKSQYSKVVRHFYPIQLLDSLSDSSAYATYFTLNANEIDPCANIDMLECFIQNHKKWNIFEDEELLNQINNVLEYLYLLAIKGELIGYNAHLYCNIPSVLYLWKRYWYSFNQRFSGRLKEIFDINGYSYYINNIVDDFFNSSVFFDKNTSRYNFYDKNLINASYSKGSVSAKDDFGKDWHKELWGEFFMVYYPLKILYGSPAFSLSLLLNR